jgi:putative intracellular protease/amidase
MSRKPKGRRYELWAHGDDHTEVMASAARLRKAGATVVVVPVRREYEQNQIIGGQL